MLALLDEIIDEPEPNWMKWCHAIAVFLKPLAACHLLAFGTCCGGLQPAPETAMLKNGRIC